VRTDSPIEAMNVWGRETWCSNERMRSCCGERENHAPLGNNFFLNFEIDNVEGR